MKNYEDLGGCYPPRPTASMDFTSDAGITLTKNAELLLGFSDLAEVLRK